MMIARQLKMAVQSTVSMSQRGARTPASNLQELLRIARLLYENNA
jgi:hypothetical protein